MLKFMPTDMFMPMSMGMGMNFGTGAGFNCPCMMDDNQSPQDNTLRSIIFPFSSCRTPPRVNSSSGGASWTSGGI
ncbi:hypothetical protein [Desulfobacter sp.]|uniref:hypothetical protein n=1 Tax=Desulfobacter sp. TaxID=2294 RepID=UPI003D0E3877